MQLYKNLKQARLRMGKSQIEVARCIGISNAALSNYETGYREPDLDTLCMLARYYGMTLDELANQPTKGHMPIYDFSVLTKNKLIAFKSTVYMLKESQKQQILRELGIMFDRFEKSKVIK